MNRDNNGRSFWSGRAGGKQRSGHYTESSNVLADAERIRTRPTPRYEEPAEQPDLVTVETDKMHASVTTGSREIPLGGGFAIGVEGPNAHGGVKHDEEITRLDLQANLGNVYGVHRNEDHELKVGYNYGYGGGARMYHGDMPGFGGDVGPLTISGRSRSLAEASGVDPKVLTLLSQDF